MMSDPRLIRAVCLSAALLAFPLLRGDEVAKRAKVEEMLLLTRADQMVDMMFAQMDPIFKAQLEKMVAAEPDRRKQEQMRADFTDVTREMLALMKEEMGWAKMKDDYIRLYSETFTESELDGINSFYKSPAGQNFLNKMPLLMTKSTQLSMGKLETFMPKMQEAMKKVAERHLRPNQ